MSSLSDLKAMGAFYTEAPVQKTIKFELDGTEYDAVIWVKKLSIGERDRLAKADSEDRSLTARMISQLITLGEEGKERIPFDEAYKLAPAVADAMLLAAKEVNGGTERKN